MTTTLFALVFGTPLAYLLGRRHLRIATLLEILIDLPTVLPPAVAGLALLMAFGRRGLWCLHQRFCDFVGITG